MSSIIFLILQSFYRYKVLRGSGWRLSPNPAGCIAIGFRRGQREAGKVLTHRQLLTAVWGPAHVEVVQYLRVYIGHLRQKQGAAAALIATVAGVGYRLLDAEDG